MNFLNKKYVSSTSSVRNSQNSYQTSSQSRLKTLGPSTSVVRQSPPIGSNNCEIHSHEQVRHMCLECVQMLCSECIAEHLEVHREANSFPRIKTLKQVKADMADKLDKVTSFINENSPEHIDIQTLKNRSSMQIEEIRRQLIQIVDQWIRKKKLHLMSSAGFDTLEKIMVDMEKLHEQISFLRNAMHTTGPTELIKKVYQLDTALLQGSYSAMRSQYREIREKSQFEMQLDLKQLYDAFETNVSIRARKNVDWQGHQQEESIVHKVASMNYQDEEQAERKGEWPQRG